ncbi:S8 family peptidase [[Ruminococcus] torques]|uniref:S8 family peptidase n=1 Tax=[Ruminococcus] torques TaxID=33039 RepID=UPI003AB7936A
MSQKLENLLNLALDADQGERERSEELDVGYDKEENVWELIVKYSGTLEAVRQTARSVTGLLNGYAVIVIEEERIGQLAQLPEVEFIEKPKKLYFQTDVGRQVSCIDIVQDMPLSLRGKGTLIGIVDSGIDYENAEFRNEDGTTRIVSLWDQSVNGRPPAGYLAGTEYTREQIDAALATEDKEVRRQMVKTSDVSGHGTAVAGIAAGNGRGSEGRRFRGAAPEAELIIVKMGAPREGGFPRTTELMRGVDYIVRKAVELRRPVAINISFGNTYGSHDGTSLVERFLNDIADMWKNVICIGSGNEGASAGHVSGKVRRQISETVELAVQQREPALSIQIWKSYVDEMGVSVISPSGRQAGPFYEFLGAQRYILGDTELLIYYGEPKPYSVKQEIYLSLLPGKQYIESGVWKIVLTPGRIVDGEYQMWLPTQSSLNMGTAFLQPNSMSTLTIPSTASLAVTVAAYDARTFSYADFSGRGPAGMYEGENVLKPDIAAPGVRVTAPVPGGGYQSFSGTSFAAPFVTGSAALLMEWGIVRGNDPYLYGEKVKAYLRKGAKQLAGYERWPNALLGYGALCVRDSLPGLGSS